MSDQTQKVAIGLDIGGTALKAGLVTSDGVVLTTSSLETHAAAGVENVLQRIVGLIQELAVRAQGDGLNVEAVGVGVPGTLSRSSGMVIAPPNLPGWRNVPIVKRLSDATGFRITLDNDANNAALGEFRCGAGRGVKNMVMLTLGTGIGGGMIFNGRLWRGAYDNAGEIGHTIIYVGGRTCGCGQQGCLEAFASATATVARAAERIESGEASTLRELLERGDALTTKRIVEHAAAGDILAQEVWEETCRYLAVGCINIQHIVNTERIVLAGGMSAAGEALRRPVVEAIERFGSRMLGDPPEIRIAELGNDAGFIGSGLSVFEPV